MSTPLSARIAGYFGTLFLAALAMLFSLWYFGWPRFGLDGAGGVQLGEVTRILEREADHRRSIIQMMISERRGDILVIAENRVMAKELDDGDPNLEQDFDRVADRLQRAYPDRYLDLLIVDPKSDRIRISTTKDTVGQIYRDKALIHRASRPGIKELIEQVESQQGTTLAVVRQIYAPGSDGYPQGALVGVLIAIMDPRALFATGLLSEVSNAVNTGTTYLFDSHAKPLRSEQGAPGVPAVRHTTVFNPLVVPGFEGTLQGADGQGRPTIQVYRHLRLNGALGWTLVHELSLADALTGLQENVNKLALGGLLIAAIALVVIALVARRLTSPLRALADTVRRLGQGHLSARVQVRPGESREIATLSDAFNDMAISVEHGHNTLESAVAARTAELAEERDRAQGYLDIAGVMLLALDAQGHISMVNRAGARLLGHPDTVLRGMNWFENFVPDSERAAARLAFTNAMRADSAAYEHFEGGVCNATGQVRVMSWNNVLLKDEFGQPIGMLSSAEDMTERKRSDAELRVAAIAFESQEGMFVTDANWSILRVNQAFSQITGYSALDALGRQPRELLGTDRQDEAFYAAMTEQVLRTGSWQGEVWDRRKNGAIFPLWLIITAVHGDEGQLTHYVASMTDITDRKAAEDEIRSLAFYDSLTGLPNRRLLMDRLQKALTSAVRHQRLGALLFVDLDDFKSLNDTLGHDKGDLLLQQVAARLRTCTRDEDTVARLGGDEFVLLIEELSDDPLQAATFAEAVGNKILLTLNQIYQVASHEYHSSPSIGITLIGERSETLEQPLKRADMAMYQAKNAGRNTYRFFDPQTQSAVETRVALESALRQAIHEQQLVLHFQPQVTAPRMLAGAEALVRWIHPERGMVPPGEFIALAEDTGLILPLGRWVLEQACMALVRWATMPHLAHLALAVNVSARQFHDPSFVGEVIALLDRTGANPRRLKLELTESVVLTHVEEMIARMTVLKARGVGFSLDDFGTGYSSLSYLKRLPLDQLKIDQGFVRDILIDPNDAAIAKMVVALAQSTGLGVIAEGVETEAQRVFLQNLGCLDYQGYLFSRPLPLAGFETFALEPPPG